MWLDALALVVLGIFVLRGVLCGGLRTGASVVSLAAAYAAGLAIGTRLGPGLAGELGWPGLLGVPLAGSAAFLITFLGCGLVGRILMRFEVGASQARSVRDRLAGGVFGAIRGGLVVVLVAWLALWVDALRTTGTFEAAPSVENSLAAAVSERAVEAAVSAAFQDAGSAGRLAASVAARPGESLTSLMRVLGHPHLAALRDDRMFWSYVEYGSVDIALDQASFIDFSFDPEVRGEFVTLGLVNEASAGDPGAFRAAAGEVLREVGPRIRGLREDEEFKEVFEDPELLAMVEEGNTLGLLSHAGFRGLVTRLAIADPAAAAE